MLKSSLVIVSKDRQAMLLDCVVSVLSGKEIPTEIIVIDQSAKRHTILADFKPERPCEFRYIWSEPLGLARASNLGISMCRNEVVAITHDDVLADEDWFGTLVNALQERGKNAVITGRVQPLPEKPGGFQLTLKTNPDYAVYDQPGNTDVLIVFNMCMYASTFREVGGFDERLGPGTPFCSADDCDLGLRLLRAGYTIHYVPEAVLFHREWRAPKDFVPMRWQYGIGRGAFYAKHLSLHDRYTFNRLRRDVRIHLSRAIHSLKKDRRTAKGDIALTLGILIGAFQWLITNQ